MTRDAMNTVVSEDLERIPKHPKEHQSELRMTYALLRKASLGKNGDPTKTRGDVMRESVASVRTRNPSAPLDYDTTYFV